MFDFHLHFVSKQQTFDIYFCEMKEASKNTVCINGRNYKLQGDAIKICWLKSKIPQLESTSGVLFSDLTKSLEALGAEQIIRGSKTKGYKYLSLQKMGDEMRTVVNRIEERQKRVDTLKRCPSI